MYRLFYIIIYCHYSLQQLESWNFFVLEKTKMANCPISKLTSNLKQYKPRLWVTSRNVAGFSIDKVGSIVPRSRGLAVTYNNQFFQKRFSLWTLCTFIVLAIVSLQGPNPYSLPPKSLEIIGVSFSVSMTRESKLCFTKPITRKDIDPKANYSG